MHAHTHVLRPLLPRVWGAHTAAPPPAFTAWQLFPGSEIQPASRGCRYLISWICHSLCLPLPLAPGSSCQALRSPRKQAEQAAGSLPSAAHAPLAHLLSSDSASLQRVNPAVLFSPYLCSPHPGPLCPPWQPGETVPSMPPRGPGAPRCC